MNIQNLKDVFMNFSSNHNRAILIDGTWGIGKTYHVLQFLKEPKRKKKNKNQITYISLFGKSSIDEMHTDIYSRLHPVKQNSKKFLNLIPKVTPLLGTFGDFICNLEFALRDTCTTPSIQKNKLSDIDGAKKRQFFFNNSTETQSNSLGKCRNIIISDDFERLNFEKIHFVDILGYVNSLFLQNFKVIVICNSKEFPETQSKEFLSFKEKVFDREYIITTTNKDIIYSYFPKEVLPLEKYILDEFDNNLRIAKRVSSFFDEVCDNLKNINPHYWEIATHQTILFYCTLIVVACNTSAYLEKNINEDSSTNIALLTSLHLDKSLHNTFICINNHVKTIGLEQINYHLISALLLLYYYNDTTELSIFFCEHDSRTSNPLLDSCFLLSDSKKEDLFKRQFDFILEQPELEADDVFKAVVSMCNYSTLSCIDEREDQIILNLLQKCNKDDIYEFHDIYFDIKQDTPRIKQFKEAFNKAKTKIFIEKINSDLSSLYTQKKYPNIQDKLNTISNNEICWNNDSDKRLINQTILDTIRNCNFFIDNLFGDISFAQWSVANKICSLSKESNFSDEVISFINNLEFNGDKSAEERYTILLKDNFPFYKFT